jgi:formylglycine-generating enzyme required for sulfatase activity/tetratricopeptide (TPR) repeat protein
MPLLPNQRLYEYQIVRALGRGGFGTVYLAHDTLLDRPVAIKELTITRQTDESAFKRFLQEARTAGGLNHPNVVTVHALKVEGSNVYLVMEYVSSGSLRGLLEKFGKLDVEQAVKIAVDVCEGLAAVHTKGIVHRDIKPENILLTEDGRAKVSDFGIAHVPRGAGGTSLTQAGFQPGTLVYMSPEQVLGKPVDARSDVYQVGELLYEMLAGKHYIDLAEIERLARDSVGSNALRMQAKVFDLLADAVCVKPPVSLKLLRPEISDQLATTVEAALAKNPAQRPTGGITLSHQLAGQPSERSAPPCNVMVSRLTPPPAPSATSRSRVSVPPHDEMALTLAPGVEMTFVRIPAGEFLMGSSNADEEALDDEKPQHRVQLDEYWMGKYPVTVAQFAAFVEATGYKTPLNIYVGQTFNHPVVDVRWDDAIAFCQWASQTTGQEVRLPTEAEWEKAARGTDGRIWPWGNEPPDSTRCNFDIETDTTPVGLYSPRGDSPYGCADMVGNALQWTSSLHRPYPYDRDDREDMAAEGARAVRGGDWSDFRDFTRCATRYHIKPDLCDTMVGFRVVSPGSCTSFGKPASLPTTSGAARPAIAATAMVENKSLAIQRFERGKQLVTQQQWERAIAEFQGAIDSWNGYIDAYHELGKAWIHLAESYRQQNASDQVVHALRSAIRADPYSVASHYYAEIIACGKSDPYVVAAYRHEVTNQPDSPEIHYNLGRVLFDVEHEGVNEERQTEFQKAVSLRPNFPEALVAIGKEYSWKQPELAVPLLQRAAGMKWPEQPLFLYTNPLNLTGRFSKGDAYLELVNAYTRLDQVDQALSIAQILLEMIQSETDAPAFLNCFARDLFGEGVGKAHADKFETAAVLLQIAIKVFSRIPKQDLSNMMAVSSFADAYKWLSIVLYRLGVQHLDQGNREETARLLDQALEACNTGNSMKPDPFNQKMLSRIELDFGQILALTWHLNN